MNRWLQRLHGTAGEGQQDEELQLAYGMVEALTNNATVAFIVCDMNNIVIYVNRTSETVFGWKAAEMIGRRLPTIGEQAWPEFQDKLRRLEWNFIDDDALRCRKDGSVFSASETIAAIRNAQGTVVSYACIVRDISARKKAERQLRESEQRFRSLFEQNSDATLSLSLDGRMTDVNRAAEGMTGYAGEELLGKALADLIVPEDHTLFQELFLEAKGSGAQQFDTALKNKQGRRVELTVKLLPILVDGEVVGIYCIAKDITSHREALTTINYMAFYDALTELPNRRLFQERLRSSLISANVGGNRFAVIWIDLDGFKHINDTYGHAAGDQVLHTIGSRLKAAVRADDTAGRMGGDEFTVLIGSVSDTGHVTKLADRLLTVLGDPIAYGDAELSVTPSIGIAVFPEDGTDVDTLLNHADRAMYHVKESGKNGYCLYSKIKSRKENDMKQPAYPIN
ncbi:diguanylate cyclase domain-containing protein [Paenibacillus chartarius]|uniref:Diguanylate cyclase domain-containing protein n=1 Tax=Paenibacillus chartarius TaxID=747481 RepID=A0ABV6DM00_9BACL